MRTALLLATVLACASPAVAQLPPPPTAWTDWDTSWHADDPGELSANGLLDKPAGRRGGVVVRDGHFYTGDTRVRFWGVNLAFGANFPTHEMAEQLARRFARYGINAVRFHHMDNQPFPNGIFADWHLEQLSPEALDRLDYFLAALKAQGVYADLNLHVSRPYIHYHRTSDGHDGPRVDKVADLFDPELIAAQKRYATDLLTHVNGYTHARYADEPAVGLVEINNENSLFMWGAEQRIEQLPEPYAAELRRQWNAWLTKRYATRDKLAAAWATAVEPAGPNLLRDPTNPAAWTAEHHGDAAVSVAAGLRVTVSRVDGTPWHGQLNQSRLTLAKGRTYHVRFTASADTPVSVGVNVGQAHEPWASLGLSRSVRIGTTPKPFDLGFAATADDDNARLSFVVGGATATLTLADVDLHAGGGSPGLNADETLGTVRPHGDDDPRARRDDWYRFLTDTEAAYYDGMRDFVHRDLGVKCPVTGTIGFGPLGTSVQAHQDFVDAHAYWQHPSFPHRDWDMADWTVENTPMVDQPAKATLWQLAATRVAGKPFTVTEYQHPAPSDWQAECIPEIATFAALQDWDGVFLFAYSHNAEYDKGRIASFFDIEGNPTKMLQMPIGARLFIGGAATRARPRFDSAIGTRTGVGWHYGFTYTVTPDQTLAGAGRTDMAAFLRAVVGAPYLETFKRQTTVRFAATAGPPDATPQLSGAHVLPPPIWSTNNFHAFADGRGGGGGGGRTDDGHVIDDEGRLYLHDGGATVDVWVDRSKAMCPFAVIVGVPADPSVPIDTSDRLLVTAVARAQNTGQQWNAARTSVGTHWGHAPVQIEVVHADVTVPGRWSHAWALDPAGRRTAVDVAEPGPTDTVLHLGKSAALAYVVER